MKERRGRERGRRVSWRKRERERYGEVKLTRGTGKKKDDERDGD